ncbi:MAG: hypothetical protein KBC64_00725 [Simkaniaceae bacterium]|nr:hypothetical protein [Simkaniaceae bacterium]
MLYAPYRRWNVRECLAKEGIVVGTDLSQEWLLPWWWDHYHRYNDYPVTFVDFGMSFEMKTWCQAHGTLLPLHVADIFVASKEEIGASLVPEWEHQFGKEVWSFRQAWFKKPLACLQSPYQYSIWIDLDCEIRGPLNALFSFCQGEEGFAIAKEVYQPKENNTHNSGVFVFKRGIDLIEQWANLSFEVNDVCVGDQNTLSRLLAKDPDLFAELPLIYNWSRSCEDNPEALIFHWHGPHGKKAIAYQMHCSLLKEVFVKASDSKEL